MQCLKEWIRKYYLLDKWDLHILSIGINGQQWVHADHESGKNLMIELEYNLLGFLKLID